MIDFNNKKSKVFPLLQQSHYFYYSSCQAIYFHLIIVWIIMLLYVKYKVGKYAAN